MEIDQLKQVSVEQARMFEDALRTLPQIELQTHHLIHGSMYARTILIPAGAALTGVLTRTDNICVVQGDISVTTDDGVVRLTGYHVIPASKGYKRVGYAHADTFWTMLIHTNETTLDGAERDLTDEVDLLQTNYLKFAEKARDDYANFLEQHGLTEDKIQADMELVGVTHLPELCEKISLGNSPIHGTGVFAVVPIQAKERIAIARKDGIKYTVGRYTNHSHRPNAEMVLNKDDSVDLVSLTTIPIGTEITIDYGAALKLAVHLNLES